MTVPTGRKHDHRRRLKANPTDECKVLCHDTADDAAQVIPVEPCYGESFVPLEATGATAIA